MISDLLHSDAIRHLIEERIDREDLIEPMQKEIVELKKIVRLQRQIIILFISILTIYAATQIL
jgi:hypothetical protein